MIFKKLELIDGDIIVNAVIIAIIWYYKELLSYISFLLFVHEKKIRLGLISINLRSNRRLCKVLI